jgi:hypothetical protein
MFTIVDRTHDTVYWIYKGQDGVSSYTDIWAHDAELCETDFDLTDMCRREIRTLVSAWLVENST